MDVLESLARYLAATITDNTVTLPWTRSHLRLALGEKVEIKLGSGQQKSGCRDADLR